MSAIALVHGTIRQVRPATKRSGEQFGHEVSVLTEMGGHLGETLRVLVFLPRSGETTPDLSEGLAVSWVVDIDSNSYGLQSRFRGTYDDAPSRSAVLEDASVF